MKKVVKRVTIVPDPMVTALSIVLSFIISIVSLVFIWMSSLEGTQEVSVWGQWTFTVVNDLSYFGRAFFTLFGLIMFLTFPILFIVSPRKYISWITFTAEGIEYHTILRRKQTVSYDKYPYILHASYLHVTFIRDYIIFTNRKLSNREQQEINHVSSSTNMIKILFREKSYYNLLEVLPVKQRAQVVGVANVILSKKSKKTRGTD